MSNAMASRSYRNGYTNGNISFTFTPRPKPSLTQPKVSQLGRAPGAILLPFIEKPSSKKTLMFFLIVSEEKNIEKHYDPVVILMYSKIKGFRFLDILAQFHKKNNTYDTTA